MLGGFCYHSLSSFHVDDHKVPGVVQLFYFLSKYLLLEEFSPFLEGEFFVHMLFALLQSLWRLLVMLVYPVYDPIWYYARAQDISSLYKPFWT